MLKSGEEKKELFIEIESLVSQLGLRCVEVYKNETKGAVSLTCLLYKNESDITTDDLEKAYNVIYPRYSVLLGERDLTLEVSSPGMGRVFKDYYEFTVFQGKRVRLYSTQYSSYISGIIETSDSQSVTLINYLIEDKKENGERMKIDYNTIAKAKLDYSWEDKND